ncbi:uncharacterized protein LOC127733874 [Mytilus californianus]|uniref:uncharacterized protein LOC127733874 n=1 Tax=Mytilus californianus TaxID=6549 RepID=UPI0022476FE4|nr:uncharacterized protein LOC127733874 [Mytilus californianus]
MASKQDPTSTTDPINKSYLGKRRHSDSEERLTGESSDNNSPPRLFTVNRTSSESSEIQSQTSSNARPINHIPKETRDWTEETIFNNLQIKDMLSPSPVDVFNTGYVDSFLKNHVKIRDYMLKANNQVQDQKHRSKYDCYAFALNEAFDVDCSVLSDLTISKALQLTEEFKKPFQESCFAKWLFEYNLNFIQLEKDKIKDMRNICQNIYPRLQQFCGQLLFMVERTHRQNSDNLTQAMYQELFVTFLRIFGVTVLDVPNLPAYHLTIGDRVVTSIPDAVVCSYVRNGEEVEEKVIAVVEVKKDYPRPDSNLEIVRQTRNSERKTSAIKHIDSGLKGQHAGEMLAVIPSSVFGSNGIYGIIVQGTMITFVSLATSQEYCNNLSEGKMKNCHATIKYSNAVNMLSTEGRKELVSTFLGMSTLLDCMSQEIMN